MGFIGANLVRAILKAVLPEEWKQMWAAWGIIMLLSFFAAVITMYFVFRAVAYLIGD